MDSVKINKRKKLNAKMLDIHMMCSNSEQFKKNVDAQTFISKPSSTYQKETHILF